MIIQPNCDAHPFIYGEIDITVTGGIMPYTYLWSGTSRIDPIAEDQIDLKSGTYSVIVTDSEGKSATAEWEITNIVNVVDDCDSNKIDIKLIGATYYSTYNLEGTVPQDNSTIEMPIYTGHLTTVKTMEVLMSTSLAEKGIFVRIGTVQLLYHRMV